MKKEILRINNLNFHYTMTGKLENISLCIFEGECVGFLGLTYSGKDLLLQLLNGEIEEKEQEFSAYIAGQKIAGSRKLKEHVYRMTASNYTIDDWTVAEYIGLVAADWFQMVFRGRALEEETENYFREQGLELDVTRKMRELTELEKRVVDLVKAGKAGAKIVIVEDEFEGMGQADTKKFAGIMKGIIAGRMAVIVNSHSNMIASLLSDKYVIFSKGRIVKKCQKNYIKNDAHLERFLLRDTVISKKMSLDSYALKQTSEKNIVYCIKDMRLSEGRMEDFYFFKGEIVTFLALDMREKERIFMVLSGRRNEEGTSYIMDSKKYGGTNTDIFAGKKIVSIKCLGSQEEIFTEMSVGENLLLPSLQKISSLEYIISSNKMSRMLTEDMKTGEAEQSEIAGNLEMNELISLTLERWYIYHPRVLVLFEPFVECDMYGVSIVKSYIKKFANRGTSVIIVKSREEYVEDISDRMIRLDYPQ